MSKKKLNNLINRISIGKRLLDILKENWFIFSLFLLSLAIGLFRLDSVPGEIWGDVIEHYYLTNSVLHGNYYFKFLFGGDGPVFSYISAFTSLFLGLSFYSLKVTTVIIGALLSVSTYLFSKELLRNEKIARIAGVLCAISFWTISFSRQGKPYILVPLFVSIFMYFLIKKKYIISGVILGLGMYTQTSFWGMFLLSLYSLPIFMATLFTSLPLITSVNDFLNSNSYIGEKLIIHNSTIINTIQIVCFNIKANLLSFSFIGDGAFRHNIPGEPHLDLISGAFFILAFLFFIYKLIFKKEKRYLFYFFLPFFAIQIPSVLDLHNPQAQPSMARMIGVVPFLYIAIAYGINSAANLSANILPFKISKRIFKTTFIALILIIIFSINTYKYFVTYPKTLPNGNTPFGKIIIEELARNPKNIPVIIVGSSWGEWGQPEEKGIKIMIKNKNYLFIQNSDINKASICNASSAYPGYYEYIFVVDANKYYLQNQIESCYRLTNRLTISKNGWNIAELMYVKK